VKDTMQKEWTNNSDTFDPPEVRNTVILNSVLINNNNNNDDDDDDHLIIYIALFPLMSKSALY